MISAEEAREQIIRDGIDAMTRSIIRLIEPCIRQRCRQFVEQIDKAYRDEIQ